ncbi:MAG TPA: D-aminoacylase [Bryobacterales bacterium]|nr:D-aminoacylase [Bryobacterales bacterium]
MRRLALLAALLAGSLAAQDFDLVLLNGRIVDGSGNPWYRADLGIRNGRIAAIGALSNRTARRTIDVRDQVVSPGFIDMMGTTSVPLLADRASAQSKLRQGITTILAGEGDSDAPRVDVQPSAGRRAAPGFQWRTFAEYFRLLEQHGIPINVVHNVGAAQVRRLVIGEENRAPSREQLDRMKALVDQAMRDGAVGLSTALIYPPGAYATTDELVELAKVAGQYGGVYFSHMRNESDHVLGAIQEAIHIGEQAGLPVHIFHLKAAGRQNWPLMKRALQLIQSARDRGLDVTADIYPYLRNGIGLGSFIHPRHYAAGAAPFLKTLSDPQVRAALRKEIETDFNWENWYHHVGESWDNVLVAQVEAAADKRFEGKSIAQIAQLRGVDPWTAFFDLVQQGGVNVNPLSMDEDQKREALRAEWMSVCTDSEPMNPATATNAHPRAFGSFVRVLAKYVRDENVITLEAAVRQMSSLPSNVLKLYDRGRIAPGMAADLLVFDPARVQDMATFTRPLAFPQGMPYVIVNGQVAIDNNHFTAANGGAVLRPLLRAAN